MSVKSSLCAAIVVGTVASFAAARLVVGILFDVPPGDGWSIAAAGCLLLITAACAAGIPARIASHIDPMWALRIE